MSPARNPQLEHAAAVLTHPSLECSDEHVGSLCVQVDAAEDGLPGSNQAMGWDSLNVTMWSGMPGLNYSAVESRSQILAST